MNVRTALVWFLIVGCLAIAVEYSVYRLTPRHWWFDYASVTYNGRTEDGSLSFVSKFWRRGGIERVVIGDTLQCITPFSGGAFANVSAATPWQVKNPVGTDGAYIERTWEFSQRVPLGVTQCRMASVISGFFGYGIRPKVQEIHSDVFDPHADF
jgi:hypothetical protein